MIERKGFRHVIEVMDPRYKLPSRNTSARSFIPKLRINVDDFQKKKTAKKVIQTEVSVAFSTDGLDGTVDLGYSVT